MSSSKGKRKIDDYEEYEDNKKVNMDQESSIQSSSKLAHLTGDIEARINQSSIGLKSLEQIKNTHCQIFNEKKLSPKKTTTNSIKYDVKPKIDNQRLSFFEEDDDDEIFDCKIYKNPDVDLSAASDSKDFLKNSSNLNSKNEWIEKVIKLKDQEIALSYNYWNGNNHTKIHKLKKGNTIEQFLKRIWPDLHCEYPELLNSTIYDLLFVKDDLILPHSYSFFDFIINKTVGKNGLLFNFDFILNDKTGLSSENPEVPLPKICLRSWYEQNKCNFPYDKWTVFT